MWHTPGYLLAIRYTSANSSKLIETQIQEVERALDSIEEEADRLYQ